MTTPHHPQHDQTRYADEDDVKSIGDKAAQNTTSVEAVENAYTQGEINEWGDEIDPEYFKLSPSMKFLRGVLWQMVLFGALSFVGPAMSDAINNLGGGGLSSPYLANLASCLNYAAGCLMTLFGGPLINKFGIKWSCVIAAVAFPLAGSGYYVRARYGGDAFLLFARLFGGFTSGFLYVGETSAMLSYPTPDNRGLYLGIWSAMRNSGSVVGGAINFSTNYSTGTAGGIAWSTYLIFIGFECSGPIFAFLLSQTRKVRRRDGSKVSLPQSNLTWKQEFQALWAHAKHKRTWLIFIPAFYSFFYGATMGTYLSLHFSVRARALSSLVTPSVTIVAVLIYGRVLDYTRLSQRTRAWIAFLLWAIPQCAAFIWIGIEYSKFGKSKAALDYILNTGAWAEAWLPYLLNFTTGYWCQLSIYWILGTFSTDFRSSSRTGGLFRAFETAGQAVAYGINANSGDDPRIAFYVNAALLALAIPSMVAIIRLVPVQPASHDDVADPVAVVAAKAEETS